MAATERAPNKYQAPRQDVALVVPGQNRGHTAVFGVLFVLLVLGAPLFLGGIIGLALAPVLGAALWGLYQLTLPRAPKQPAIDDTAGNKSCPSCGSVQTDFQQFEGSWRCFACDHRW